MKIRIKGNSIRYRLSMSEVEAFCQLGFIEDKTEFGDNVFFYTLERVNNGGDLNADFEEGTITMYVPEHLVRDWDKNEVVSIGHSKELGEGNKLVLLLEKDFKCIDNTMNEDQSDNYDHPEHTCS